MRLRTGRAARIAAIAWIRWLPSRSCYSRDHRPDCVQVIDVHIPTTDARTITLTRYTEPEPELKLLLEKLKLGLPPQRPPKITAAQAPPHSPL